MMRVMARTKMTKTPDLESEEREEKKNGRWGVTPRSVIVESSGYMLRARSCLDLFHRLNFLERGCHW